MDEPEHFGLIILLFHQTGQTWFKTSIEDLRSKYQTRKSYWNPQGFQLTTCNTMWYDIVEWSTLTVSCSLWAYFTHINSRTQWTVAYFVDTILISVRLPLARFPRKTGCAYLLLEKLKYKRNCSEKNNLLICLAYISSILIPYIKVYAYLWPVFHLKLVVLHIRYLSKSVNVRVETDHLLLAYHVTNIFSELNHSVTI